MKNMIKKQLFFKMFFVFLFVNIIMFASSTNLFGQSSRNYGSVGTLKTFQGQVKDVADGSIPNATIWLRNVNVDEEKSVEANENGLFIVKDLPSGEYKVRTTALGFVQAEFIVKISPCNSTTSEKYITIRLCPCRDGGSVKLKSQLTKE